MRIGLVSATMGACVWVGNMLIPSTGWWASWGGHAARCAAGVTIGGGVYALAALGWRAPEIRWLLRRSPGGGGGPSGMSFE